MSAAHARTPTPTHGFVTTVYGPSEGLMDLWVYYMARIQFEGRAAAEKAAHAECCGDELKERLGIISFADELLISNPELLSSGSGAKGLVKFAAWKKDQPAPPPAKIGIVKWISSD